MIAQTCILHDRLCLFMCFAARSLIHMFTRLVTCFILFYSCSYDAITIFATLSLASMTLPSKHGIKLIPAIAKLRFGFTCQMQTYHGNPKRQDPTLRVTTPSLKVHFRFKGSFVVMDGCLGLVLCLSYNKLDF